MKRAIVPVVALLLSAGLVGCGTKENTLPRIECDKGDQLELDSDCGYWKNYQFIWYPWVNKGKTSFSPEGFQTVADDNTAPVDSGSSGRRRKSH